MYHFPSDASTRVIRQCHNRCRGLETENFPSFMFFVTYNSNAPKDYNLDSE